MLIILRFFWPPEDEPCKEALVMFSFARISFIRYFCWSLAAAKSVPDPAPFYAAALLSMLFMTTWLTRFMLK